MLRSAVAELRAADTVYVDALCRLSVNSHLVFVIIVDTPAAFLYLAPSCASRDCVFIFVPDRPSLAPYSALVPLTSPAKAPATPQSAGLLYPAAFRSSPAPHCFQVHTKIQYILLVSFPRRRVVTSTSAFATRQGPAAKLDRVPSRPSTTVPSARMKAW
jgi:hypothetical protein